MTEMPTTVSEFKALDDAVINTMYKKVTKVKRTFTYTESDFVMTLGAEEQTKWMALPYETRKTLWYEQWADEFCLSLDCTADEDTNYIEEWDESDTESEEGNHDDLEDEFEQFTDGLLSAAKDAWATEDDKATAAEAKRVEDLKMAWTAYNRKRHELAVEAAWLRSRNEKALLEMRISLGDTTLQHLNNSVAGSICIDTPQQRKAVVDSLCDGDDNIASDDMTTYYKVRASILERIATLKGEIASGAV